MASLKMRAEIVLFVLFLKTIGGQEDATTAPQEERKVIKLCSVCTCSEINSVDNELELVLNVQCSELDRIEDMPDLDKIIWPENTNGLKISATFEGLGLSTLEKLPANDMVERLNFNNNMIKMYWPDPFSDLPNLKKLSFTSNELVEITPDLFTNIEKLEDLDLSYNKLPEFHRRRFDSLKNLKKLNIRNNLLKNIPVETLENMEALEELDLGKNRILDVLLKRTDNAIFKNIKRLFLNDNRIRTITKDAFPDMNSFEILDLSNNIIETVDEDSFISCTSLTELNLGQNNITFNFILPASLKIATLKQNTMHRWPSFPNDITYIDLSFNRLTDLFDSNVNFDSLEVLNIAGNQLKEINLQTILPKVFSLDVSYNLLQDIPPTLNFINLPNLEELRLDGNPIHVIFFKNVISVRNLYISDMQLVRSVDDKAFSNVGGKYIEENGKERICVSIFMTNCKSLSEIQDGAFDGTPLCSLDISRNNLTSLARGLVDWSQLLDGINLQWNPWDCSCHLQWMLTTLLPSMYNKHPHLLTDFRCESPRGVQGLRLVHWYNWTDHAMCNNMHMRSGPHDSFLLEPSTSSPEDNLFWGISTLTLILGISVIISSIIAIGLIIYLIANRKRYNVRQAAMKRKRQRRKDAKNNKAMHNEQFKALYRV